jgi:hypothetical protein
MSPLLTATITDCFFVKLICSYKSGWSPLNRRCRSYDANGRARGQDENEKLFVPRCFSTTSAPFLGVGGKCSRTGYWLEAFAVSSFLAAALPVPHSCVENKEKSPAVGSSAGLLP